MSLTDTRAGIILRLVDELHDVRKIQLQKLVYFLQSRGVPLGYRFVMHHYGPYSFELDDHISLLDAASAIQVSVDPEGYGYHITGGDFRPEAWVKAGAEQDRLVGQVIGDFQGYNAADLELAATIHFVHEILGDPDEARVVEVVHELKPKFPPPTIKREFQRLVDASYLPAGRRAPGA
jgi:hypothetical protein